MRFVDDQSVFSVAALIPEVTRTAVAHCENFLETVSDYRLLGQQDEQKDALDGYLDSLRCLVDLLVYITEDGKEIVVEREHEEIFSCKRRKTNCAKRIFQSLFFRIQDYPMEGLYELQIRPPPKKKKLCILFFWQYYALCTSSLY